MRNRIGLTVLLAAFVAGGAHAAFTEEDVRISEATSGIELAGTLTLPPGEGPHPAALIVAASGAHSRREARSGGRHWDELAHRLATAGVATLALDNRGVGGSTVPGVEGWTYEWTSDELVRDSEAALAWLRGHDEIDPKRVGLVGFSDGAWRAALLTGRRGDDVAFLAVLSPSGAPGAENLVATQLQNARAAGVSDLEALEHDLRRAIEHIVEGRDRAAAVESAKHALSRLGIPSEQLDAAARGTVGDLWQAGTREILRVDAGSAYAEVSAPVLALFGEADRRQPVEANLPSLSANALRSAADFEARVLPGLGHFLESPDRAEEDPPRFATAVTDALADWIGAFAEDRLAGDLRPLEPLIGSWLIEQERVLDEAGSLLREQQGGRIEARSLLRGTMLELRARPAKPAPESEALLWLLTESADGIEAVHRTSEKRGELRANATWKDGTLSLAVPGGDGEPLARAELTLVDDDRAILRLYRRGDEGFYVGNEGRWQKLPSRTAALDQ